MPNSPIPRGLDVPTVSLQRWLDTFVPKLKVRPSVEGLAEGVRYVTNMVVQQDGESGQAFNLDQYGEFLEKMEGKK